MLKKGTKKKTPARAGTRKGARVVNDDPKKVKLRQGCWRSRINVTPANYLEDKKAINQNWIIWYRYYDPVFKKEFPYGKYLTKKGMNEHESREARIESTKLLIEELKVLFDVHHYNPITDRINPAEKEITADKARELELQETELTPDTLLIPALWVGYKDLKYVDGCMTDIRSVIRGIEEAATQFSFNYLPISVFRPKHFIKMFNWLSENRKSFSVKREGKYIAYLSAIFAVLVKREAIEINPIRDIPKRTEKMTDEEIDEKLKVMSDESSELLTQEERQIIDKHLFVKAYTFWRYTNMFFHSSIRSTEFFKVKLSHINLKEQFVWTLVRKRKGPTWVKRIIKDAALHLWVEIVQECLNFKAIPGNENIDPYIFSRGLRPGAQRIDEEAVTKRWHRWVVVDPNGYNNGLGIKKGFYKIKSLATTEHIDILQEVVGIKKAEAMVAEHSAHTTPKMVQSVYDKKNNFRREAEVKSIMNSFAGL